MVTRFKKESEMEEHRSVVARPLEQVRLGGAPPDDVPALLSAPEDAFWMLDFWRPASEQ